MTQNTITRKPYTADDIANVQLSNREQHGEYVCYTALSRDGVTPYRVTLHDGRATGCSCMATLKCRHMVACEFEEAWSAPIVAKKATAKRNTRKAVPSVQFEDWGECDDKRAGRRFTHEYVSVCVCDACRTEHARREIIEAPERERIAAEKAELAAKKRAAFEAVVAEVRAIEHMHAEEQLVEGALIATEVLGEFAQDLAEHVADGELNVWDDPAWAALSEQEKAQDYRNMYSDDFYCDYDAA